jgi:hypothetical protein
MHTIAEDHVLQSTQTASHRFRSGFAIAARVFLDHQVVPQSMPRIVGTGEQVQIQTSDLVDAWRHGPHPRQRLARRA